MPAPQPLILPRILPGGGVVGLGDETVARAAFTSNWGGIRAAQVHLDGGETPSGALVNNLISMNLGAESVYRGQLRGARLAELPHPAPRRQRPAGRPDPRRTGLRRR